MNKTIFKSDRQVVVDIIADSFVNNPSVLSVVRKSRLKRRIAGLASYAFKFAYRRNGVFLSSDKSGVAICYRFNVKKESLPDYWAQLILLLTSLSLKRVPKLLEREKYLKTKRPASGDFLYFWFFGVHSKGKGRGAAVELKNAIFAEAEQLSLPIYLETSVEKNRRVYERYGFTVHEEWYNEKEGITLWLMSNTSFCEV